VLQKQKLHVATSLIIIIIIIIVTAVSTSNLSGSTVVFKVFLSRSLSPEK
jgi:hypothetical protein